MKNLGKLITILVTTFLITFSYQSSLHADSHTAEKQIIQELRKKIFDLGAEPKKKKHLFQRDKNWIADLKEQLENLEKEKTKKERFESAKKEIEEEIEALGAKPISKTDELDDNEEILALREQLKKLKKDQEEKDSLNKAQKAEDEKTEKNKKDRNKVIQAVKKEILFLGETPISEFESNNEDQYVAALNKQLEEVKALKEQEEKEIEQSIPSWFIKLPRGSEQKIYVRGTAVVDTLQGSIDSSTNAALRELGKKLETRLNSKLDETMRQAGIGEDMTTKTEINRVSTLVVKEVTISGYEIAESKLIKLDNGSYRSFILLEYPVAQVYQAFMNRMEQSPVIKKNLSALKNTEAFKELEYYVNEFTGA